MLTFILQIKDTVENGSFHAFSLFFLYTWIIWAVKIFIAKKYVPFGGESNFGTSVVIPVVDEPTDIFEDVLFRIKQQKPDEIIVVINGQRNVNLEKVCEEQQVDYIWTKEAGKRNALKIGIEATSKEIVVLVDSDTLWEEDTLHELVKPFNFRNIGGVTTKQNIIRPERNMVTMWASWLEEMRNRYSMPAMSVFGQVGCLPGRTIAFRRNILENSLPQFMSEKFLGVKLEVSDDRALTNYCLKQGYKTVMQNTSNVWTDAPTDWKTLYRQQLRWSRGSQYNTMRMIPWMLKNTPFLFVLYVSDILMPFFLIGIVCGWFFSVVTGDASTAIYSGIPLDGLLLLAFIFLTIIVGIILSFSSRQLWAVQKYRSKLLVFMLINTFLLTPVRVIGFFGMARNAGWGTRKNSFNGVREYNLKTAFPKVLGLTILSFFVYISM